MDADEHDSVQLEVDRLIFTAARRAYGYTPADERPERIAEELADEDEAAPDGTKETP